MPEPTDEELGLDPQQMEGLDPNIRGELRRSRQLAKDLAAAQVEAEVAKRDASFIRAGIPDNPLGQLFAKAYDGDYNDPAAIKQAFDALGIPGNTPGQAPQEPDGPTDDELAAQRRIAQAGATGDNDGSIPYEEAFKTASNESEVLALLEQAPTSATDIDGRRITLAQIE